MGWGRRRRHMGREVPLGGELGRRRGRRGRVVGCAHQAKHAQRNRHITDVDEFPLAFGNWRYR